MSLTYEVIPIRVRNMDMINYCYLIVDLSTNEAALVDPAWESDTIEGVLNARGARLKSVLLTHSHIDHVNLAEWFAAKYNAAVYMGIREIEYYRFSCAGLNGLAEADTVRLGDTEVSLLLTPGHTAGSVCYTLEGHMFTGDTLFTEGCGICSGIGADPGQMFDSLQTIKALTRAHVRICPGHSFGQPPGQRFDDVMDKNIYLQITDKEHFINFRMRKNQTNLFHFQ